MEAVRNMPRLTRAIQTVRTQWVDNRDAILAIVDQAIVSLASFLIGIFVARTFGLAEFGQFVIVLIVIGLLQALHHALISLPLLTLAGLRRRSASYFKTVNLASALLALVCAICAALAVAVLFAIRGEPLPVGLMISAFTFCTFQCLHTGVRRMLFAQRKSFLGLGLDLFRYAIFLILLAAFWRYDVLSTNTVLMALGVSALVSLLPLIPLLVAGTVARRLLISIVRRHWLIGRWVLAMPLVTVVHGDLVVLGVGAMIGDDGAGSLRAGQYLLGVTHFIMMAMENFVPTQAAAAMRQGGQRQLISFLFDRGLKFGIMVGGLIALLIAAPGFWLDLAFGDGHAALAPLLLVFSVAYGFMFVRDIVFVYFRTWERTEVLFHAALAGALAVLVALYPMVSAFGVMGGALVILMAEAAFCSYALIAAYFDYRER